MRPVVISGPSGAGKSTLISKLQQRFPGQFTFSVSHTTRRPREGETDGTAYHFVSRDAFMALVDADGFVEHTESYGNLYGRACVPSTKHARIPTCGVSSTSIRWHVKDGVKNFKARCAHLNALYVFVSPPSFDILESRLRGRGRGAEEESVVLQRLEQCESELAYARTGAYDAIVVNDDLDRAFQVLLEVLESDGKAGAGDALGRIPKR